MRIFAGYIRKYRIKTAICIVLLFAEAALCLFVPAVLGEIIGTGIQSKGFSDDYPVVVSKNAFALFCEILPRDKSERLQSFYEFLDEAPDSLSQRYHTDKRCYYAKNADNEELQELYRNAVFSAIVLARGVEGYEDFDYNSFLENVSLNSVYIYAGSRDFSEAEKKELYETAVLAGDAIKMQAGDILLPFIYEDAGIDCESVQKEFIRNNGILCFCAVLGQFLLALISSLLTAKISSGIENDMRTDILNKAFSFTKTEMQKFPSGHFYELITSGVDMVGTALNLGMRIVFYSLFTAVAGSIISFIKSVQFGLFIIGSSLLLVFCGFIIFKLTVNRYFRMQDSYGSYSRSIMTNLSQIFTVRVINGERTEAKKNCEFSEMYRHDESFVMKAVLIVLSVAGLAVNLLTVLIVIAGGNSMLTSEITIGNIITYLQYALISVSAFMMLGAAVIFAPNAIRSLGVLDELFSVQSVSEKFKNNTLSPDIFESVTFDSVKLFEHSREVSFTLKKGQVLALQGATGTGKSLLMDVLMREFVPFSGRVSINSQDINTLTADYPEKHIGYVPSRPVLFSATVRDNMLLRGAENDDSVLMDALRRAQCSFIVNDEKDLNIYLKNAGTSLSGGQRSRLSLAGVLAKKADIYIFDDCLTAVDRENRDKILKNIYELKKDAAVIIISQDINDISEADIIKTI